MIQRKTPVGEMIRAVIYARYSSSAQKDESIEQQIAACKEYAQRNGLRIVAIYADHAMSGRTDRRPEFQKMLRHAESGEFSMVLAYKSNRIARNMLNALAHEEKLARLGITVSYVKEEFGDNAAGRFALRTMMNLNQFFSESLSEDVRRGMEDNAKQCRVNGQLPLGYKKGSDGRYEIDENTAPIVREIFRRIADGELQASIADDLNARNILTAAGKRWNKGSFHCMLSNVRYMGVYVYGDIRVENGIPAIVDPELFDKVQRRVEHMKTLVKSRRRRPDVDYLLTGKLFCGHCKSAMVGTSGTSKSGTMYYYYRCNNQAVAKTCNKKAVAKDIIEQMVVRAIKDYVLQDDVIEQIADLVMHYKKKVEDSSDLSYLEERLKESKAASKNIMKAIEAGIFNKTTNERLQELEREQAELVDQINEERRHIPRLTRKDVIYWLESFRSGDIEDQDYQKKLIQSFLRAVYLYDDHIRITFDFDENDAGVDVQMDNDSVANESDESGCVLISSPRVYHNVLIRTPVKIQMVGSVFVLAFYFDIL